MATKAIAWPRYQLRRLLIWVAIVPVLIAFAWYAWVGTALSRSAARSDTTIREDLLSHTPKGTPAAKVLSYVDHELTHDEPTKGYFEWVRAYDAASGRVSSIGPWSQRTIEAIVGLRVVGFVANELVIATWHFDDNDCVSDVTIDRRTIGP